MPLFENIKTKLTNALDYAKEHPVKTGLIIGGAAVAVVGTVALIKRAKGATNGLDKPPTNTGGVLLDSPCFMKAVDTAKETVKKARIPRLTDQEIIAHNEQTFWDAINKGDDASFKLWDAQQRTWDLEPQVGYETWRKPQGIAD